MAAENRKCDCLQKAIVAAKSAWRSAGDVKLAARHRLSPKTLQFLTVVSSEAGGEYETISAIS